MPDWLQGADFAVKTATTAATITIGYFAWKIATRQVQIASDKLKLDLFDRRYAVYLALNEWMLDLQGRHVPDEEYTKYMRRIEPVQFLFGLEVNEWVRGLRKKARAMNHARKVLEETRTYRDEERRREEVGDANKTYTTLTREFDLELEGTPARLAAYLGFGKAL